ncbi:DUF4474 domain-containing protein [Desulfosporosinus fructosivorans]|uniref:DUF4474 domain-containing protein n=1 Tax=Desulfosporosinus fructosivorans TaxID=2018669 RepID=A0A4Z0R2I8_9FIRM|nr:DUF4474 domain-containing protein [Desulfosporosinus fructosivorans]TGE36207.1 DUF4474 domain-containing protein [Desulfosporosinus fructosivorans]
MSIEASNVIPEGTGNDELDKAIEMAGYSYDPTQDIFYSTMDPWQRDIGYCRLYDELAAPLGMIIDCEPIVFDYLDKKWMIGFWKGQYDLVTGCEIGIYTKAFDIDVFGVIRGAYYNCASNTDLLQMSYTLKKNDQPLFTRAGKHWWLTGFKLGEFSDPSELSMDITITLHNVSMRDAFVNGLWNAGYPLAEFTRNSATVSFSFTTPHTPPPITRTPNTDRIIQRKNQLLCEKYLEITGTSSNIKDKVKAIEEQSPEIYDKLFKAGISKQLYETFSSRLTPIKEKNK